MPRFSAISIAALFGAASLSAPQQQKTAKARQKDCKDLPEGMGHQKAALKASDKTQEGDIAECTGKT